MPTVRATNRPHHQREQRDDLLNSIRLQFSNCHEGQHPHLTDQARSIPARSAVILEKIADHVGIYDNCHQA